MVDTHVHHNFSPNDSEQPALTPGTNTKISASANIPSTCTGTDWQPPLSRSGTNGLHY